MLVVCALGAVATLSVGVVAAEQPESQSARGLAARMMAAADGFCGPSTVPAIPECLKARPADQPDYDVGANSVLAQPDWALMPAACFDAKNPPSWEVQQMVNAAMEAYRDRYQLNTRWPGATGTPLTITWSFVPDGLSIPSGIGEPSANSILFSRMDTLFGAANRAVWIAQFQACFDRWAALTGTSYTRITVGANPWDDGAAWGTAGAAGARGDVRISMKNIDGGSNVLAYNAFPTSAPPLSPGDMVIDSSEAWASGAPGYIFLRNTLMHEHGHGLGLLHVCPVQSNKLMEPFLNTNFDGPQHDDIRSADRHYGDAYESNNTQATASAVGSSSVGFTLTPSAVPAPAVGNGSLTAISVDGDEDWYSFTSANPILGTITVTPLGATYPDFAQTANCNEAAPVTNSLAQANLVLDLMSADGATTIATVDATAAGSAETLVNVLYSPPGTLKVRVRENGAPTQSQLYSLTIAGNSATSITASDNTFPDRVQLNWTAIPGAVTYNLFRGTTNVRASATALASPATNSFPDTTAVPGTTYFYWAEVNTGLGGSRPVAGPDSGVRQISAPANDACANAIVVTNHSVTNATLAGATNDAALGSCGTATTNPDVWYRYTAGSCPGTLTVSTCGSHDTGGVNAGTDTVLSLVATCGGAELACNDDAPQAGLSCGALDAGGVLRDSMIVRALAAGESVLIRVSRFSTTTGTAFTLRVDFAPANDLCANAATIASVTPVTWCNNDADTDGPVEALCNNAGDNNINGDLWYRWTAVTNGRFTASLCNNGTGLDTKVGIYPNSCPAATGTVLGCNDDACGIGNVGSRTSALGVAGTSYLIRVGGFTTNRGAATLIIHCAADVNLSGVVSVQDIFDFLEYYFSNNPLADINGSGAISVQDIFDFLEYYFQGC